MQFLMNGLLHLEFESLQYGGLSAGCEYSRLDALSRQVIRLSFVLFLSVFRHFTDPTIKTYSSDLWL